MIEIFTGLWKDIEPHAERDGVFIVSQELDLKEVAESVAKDDLKQVSSWITDGSIKRPTAEQMQSWHQQAGTLFRIAIVQPYVLIQPEAH